MSLIFPAFTPGAQQCCVSDDILPSLHSLTLLLAQFILQLYKIQNIRIFLSLYGENNWSLVLAGMKAYIHQQHQELFWLRMVRTTTACLRSCLQDFQNPCIIRF